MEDGNNVNVASNTNNDVTDCSPETLIAFAQHEHERWTVNSEVCYDEEETLLRLIMLKLFYLLS